MIGFIKRAFKPSYDVALIEPDDDQRNQLHKHFLCRDVSILAFRQMNDFFEHKRFGYFDVILMPLHAPDFRGPQARIETYRRDPLTPVIIYGHHYEQREFEQLITIGQLLQATNLQTFLEETSKKQSEFEHMVSCQWTEATEPKIAMEI